MRLTGSEGFQDMQDADKIIVRSNGTVTYVGKDIAYQLWKFGLLGTDFRYRHFERTPKGCRRSGQLLQQMAIRMLHTLVEPTSYTT